MTFMNYFFHWMMYVIENKELNHITSDNIVKEFKKLTKARKSWNPDVSKRVPKRKSGNVTQSVKRLKVKPEPTWSVYHPMGWIFPIQFSLFHDIFNEFFISNSKTLTGILIISFFKRFINFNLKFTFSWDLHKYDLEKNVFAFSRVIKHWDKTDMRSEYYCNCFRYFVIQE